MRLHTVLDYYSIAALVAEHLNVHLPINLTLAPGRVPFYLCSGKRLAKRTTEIVIEYESAPHTPWSASSTVDGSVRPNLLVVNVSPEEDIIIGVEAKRLGTSDVAGFVTAQMSYNVWRLEDFVGDAMHTTAGDLPTERIRLRRA